MQYKLGLLREKKKSQNGNYVSKCERVYIQSLTHSLTTWFYPIAQTGPELVVFLLQPSKCWDYRYVAPLPASLHPPFLPPPHAELRYKSLVHTR